MPSLLLTLTRPATRLVCTLLALFVAAPVLADDLRLASVDMGRAAASPEGLFAKAYQEMRANRPDSALANVDRLISIRPDFKLAYLLKGDLLLAKTRPLATFGAAPAASSESLADLKEEARVRVLRYIDQPPADSLPAQILRLSPSQKYALLADASRARLFVFENVGGEPRLVRDFYVSVGRNGVNKRSEGDKRTPVGIYTIADELPRRQLTDFYGAGAFPLDYPNEWDQSLGRSGHGIWLHGVPSDTYSRPPKASDGCLVVSNPDYTEIARYIRGGTTPFFIAERTDWLDRTAWLARRQALLNQIDTWKADWQRMDANRFLGHYSDGFLAKAGRGWAETKRRNIVQKDWIRVNLSDMSVFLYPSNDLAVVTFTQTYDSDKHRDVSRKRLYLRLEEGSWRIALEKSLETSSTMLAARD